MSFLDSLKQDALAVLHATANALHAQLANTLAQAGHAVTEADHVDTLVKTAQAAATGAASAPAASTIAPNYADAALARFNQSMMVALVQFAQQHLPAKFQGVAEEAATVVETAAAGAPVAAIVDDGLKVAQAAVSVVEPSAAPIAAVVEPIVEQVIDDLAGAPSSTEPVVASNSAPAPGPAMNQNGV